MKKPVLLSVEDDEDIQELLRYNLVKAGFAVFLAESGEEAIEKLGGTAPDLVILDLMLPGMNGLEVCKTMKRIDSLKEIPIIMLTAKGEEIDVITGLDLGADDYVSKPFSPKVLVARIKAVLRKKTEKSASEAKEESSLIVQGSLAIDPAKYEVKVEGIKVRLTVTEFNILKLLAKREGWVFTRQQIIDAVKGYEFSVTPRAVDVHIFSLRSKLGKAGEKIESIRGIGYRLR